MGLRLMPHLNWLNLHWLSIATSAAPSPLLPDLDIYPITDASLMIKVAAAFAKWRESIEFDLPSSVYSAAKRSKAIRVSCTLFLGMLTAHLLHSTLNFSRHPGCLKAPSWRNYPVSNRKAKILCYVNTYKANFERKAVHVQHTWARRCDKYFFTSTTLHPNLSVLLLNMSMPEVRSHLWVKMRNVLRRLYAYIDDYDYFFKADDDTYTIVENLRALLRHHSPDDPFMLGYRWNVLCPGGFFSGGAGYLLSREALRRLVERAIDKHPSCPTKDEDQEDVKTSYCAKLVGVKMLDTYGETGLSVFHPYNLPAHFNTSRRSDLLNGAHVYQPENPFLRRVTMEFSERHVSFHYVENTLMYLIDYVIYYLHPFAPRNA